MSNAVATAFEPVEFWNAVYPNEQIRVPRKGTKDRAADEIVQFFAGYRKANTPREVEIIETYCRHAHRADSPIEFKTESGWTTKSSEAFKEYSKRHGL